MASNADADPNVDCKSKSLMRYLYSNVVQSVLSAADCPACISIQSNNSCRAVTCALENRLVLLTGTHVLSQFWPFRGGGGGGWGNVNPN